MSLVHFIPVMTIFPVWKQLNVTLCFFNTKAGNISGWNEALVSRASLSKIRNPLNSWHADAVSRSMSIILPSGQSCKIRRAYRLSLRRPSRKVEALPLQFIFPFEKTRQFPPKRGSFQIAAGNRWGWYWAFSTRRQSIWRSIVHRKFALYTVFVNRMMRAANVYLAKWNIWCASIGFIIEIAHAQEVMENDKGLVMIMILLTFRTKTLYNDTYKWWMTHMHDQNIDKRRY